MFSQISIEKLLRAIRFAALSVAAIYGAQVALAESGYPASVKAACADNECRTTFYRDGPRQYCTAPGTSSSYTCVGRTRSDGSFKCFDSFCGAEEEF